MVVLLSVEAVSRLRPVRNEDSQVSHSNFSRGVITGDAKGPNPDVGLPAHHDCCTDQQAEEWGHVMSQ